MAHVTIAALDDLAIQRAKTGDLEALEQLYRAYEGTVYTVARRMCRTAEDAEDVLQETFFEICRSIERFRGEGPGSLTAWIKRIAASKALIKLRYEKYREADELLDDWGGGAAGAAGAEPTGGVGTAVAGARAPDVGLQLDLEGALAALSDTARAVVWLHDVEGYTHEEIAELMGKSVSFSKSQLSRAHARLRKWLGEEA